MHADTDLHLHTTASDGSCTPQQLVGLLRQRGIHTFAITDHDTVAGAEQLLADPPEGMRFIPGVEFSCRSAVGKYHILGYGVDPADPLLQAAIREGQQLRLSKLEGRLAYLKQVHGIAFTPGEENWLRSQQSPGKPQLGLLLLRRGLGSTMVDVLRQYINPFKGGNDRIDAETAIRAIVHAGGVPVWAHPLGGEGKRHKTPEELAPLLCDLLSLGIQGMECWYSRYTRQETAFLTAQARRHSLLISGGSDFHGTPKPGLEPGTLCSEDASPGPGELTLLERV
jgi:predicted metal-dependent phosphoesterase TrpH